MQESYIRLSNNISPVLSICIPTYGRVEVLHKTLESIYRQKVDLNLFEVCISDNSPTDETKEMLDEYFSDIKNISYSKSFCEGYFNSIEALKLGKGKFLKLHNNYSMFADNMLAPFLQIIESYDNEKPLIFFSLGKNIQSSLVKEYESFDLFLYNISYFSTWSTSFGIWKVDFENLLNQSILLNKMFPHTSLLFALTSKEKYVIDDNNYFLNQDVGKKGGYNLPETFGSCYLSMVDDLLNKKVISKNTYDRIYKGILLFISEWYLNCKMYRDKYQFSFEKWHSIVRNVYGLKAVLYIYFFFILHFPKGLLKKCLRKY